jgi:hypothetical protein
MADTSTCYSFTCRTTVDGIVATCPKCGTKMRTPARVRGLGWFLLLIGLFLVGFMGIITWNMAPMLLHPGDSSDGGSRFTGTAEQAQSIFWLFAIVIAFGAATMVNGGFQIATGRRNRWITVGTLGVAAILFVVAWFTNRTLGG